MWRHLCVWCVTCGESLELVVLHQGAYHFSAPSRCCRAWWALRLFSAACTTSRRRRPQHRWRPNRLWARIGARHRCLRFPRPPLPGKNGNKQHKQHVRIRHQKERKKETATTTTTKYTHALWYTKFDRAPNILPETSKTFSSTYVPSRTSRGVRGLRGSCWWTQMSRAGQTWLSRRPRRRASWSVSRTERHWRHPSARLNRRISNGWKITTTTTTKVEILNSMLPSVLP